MNMLKGALQWSVYRQRTERIYRRFLQPLLCGLFMLVLILPTSKGWKAEWTLAGKINPRRSRGLNLGPSGQEAELLPLRLPSTYQYNKSVMHFFLVTGIAVHPWEAAQALPPKRR